MFVSRVRERVQGCKGNVQGGIAEVDYRSAVTSKAHSHWTILNVAA